MGLMVGFSVEDRKKNPTGTQPRLGIMVRCAAGIVGGASEARIGFDASLCFDATGSSLAALIFVLSVASSNVKGVVVLHTTFKVLERVVHFTTSRCATAES